MGLVFGAGSRKRRRFRIAFGVVVAINTVALPATAYFMFFAGPPHPAGYDDLMSAIESKGPARVEAVLRRGVDPNIYPNSEADETAEDDIAPIDVAAEDGSAEIVRLLLKHGADPNLGDGWHYNPLAAAEDNVQVMALLIQHGAKVNDGPNGSLALWRAAMDGKVTTVKFLLAHGANPNTTAYTSVPNESLLHALISSGGSEAVARLLRKAGAKG